MRNFQRQKDQHEDEALEALCLVLRAAGHEAVIVGRPDREQGWDINVDAVLSIDGIRWAVEHSHVARPPQRPTELNVGRDQLSDAIDQIATEYGCDVFVRCKPFRFPAGADRHANRFARDAATNFYAALLERVRHAAITGEIYISEHGSTQVWATPSDNPSGALALTTSDSIWVGSDVIAGLRAHLTTKLAKQLQPAKDAGYHTLLLLDQIPRAGGVQTIRNATARSIGPAVKQIIEEAGIIPVDQIWLRGSMNPSTTMILQYDRNGWHDCWS